MPVLNRNIQPHRMALYSISHHRWPSTVASAHEWTSVAGRPWQCGPGECSRTALVLEAGLWVWPWWASALASKALLPSFFPQAWAAQCRVAPTAGGRREFSLKLSVGTQWWNQTWPKSDIPGPRPLLIDRAARSTGATGSAPQSQWRSFRCQSTSPLIFCSYSLK